MTKHEFLFIGTPLSEYLWQIDKADEIHHIQKVLRLKEGDSCAVTDGKGTFAKGTIKTIEKTVILIELNEPCQKFSGIRRGVAIGSLKPSTIDKWLPAWIEMGISEFHFFAHQHTPKTQFNEKNFHRWERISLSALKQSKNSLLPHFYRWDSIEKMVGNLKQNYHHCFICDPETDMSLARFSEPRSPCCAVIAGEMGWQTGEKGIFLENGFVPVKIANRVLRSQTCVLAFASWVEMNSI